MKSRLEMNYRFRAEIRNKIVRSRAYGLQTGTTMDNDRYVLALKLGLGMQRDDFACYICWNCEGRTCEGWAGACQYCSGTGLMQGDGFPAFDSQRHQVLEAAARSGLMDDVKVV